MNDIVFFGDNGQLVTTSLKVAEVFGKEHKNVLRDIESMSCSKNFHVLNFELSFNIRELPNGGNKQEKYYTMTKDGFTFLVMGYRGVKAAQFKESYIEAFNKMEKAIKEAPALPSPIDTTILKQLVEATQVMAAQISQMQVELNKQRDLLASPILATPLSSGEQRISPRQCKYYTVKQMAKALNSDARQLNAFLEYEGIQDYDSVKQRWVLNSSIIGCGLTYTVVYEPVDPDEEPREYMVWTPKGRDYIWWLLVNEKRKSQENAIKR